ncbi:hypothetical protein DXT89_26745 [Agrobacterium vitis]|uniref:Uncharacterized protein n=2 Tax=Agrobacterium vitis TaxID=373 RepID=A0A7J4WX53_AGRVI|nr:hypothetical protein DXT89_26745 [Agrobacterium vitis]
MIERVARALYDASPYRDNEGSYDEQSPMYKSFCLALASAAIEAMREPTEAMVKKGVEFSLSSTLSGNYRWQNYVADKHRAMIDAALKEGE